MYLSCPSASGNYSWENLALSEIDLDLVFVAPALFSITVVWKWIFRQTENSDLQIRALDFAQLEETVATQPESRTGFMYTGVTAVEVTGSCK